MQPEKGFSAARMLRATPADRFEKSQFIKLASVKSGVSRTSGRKKILAQTVSIDKKAPDRTKYITSIEIFSRQNIKVSCSCSDFMFRWEYALEKKGGADLVYGNGDPPVDRNPALKPGVCKHLLALIDRAKEKSLIE